MSLTPRGVCDMLTVLVFVGILILLHIDWTLDKRLPKPPKKGRRDWQTSDEWRNVERIAD